MNRGEPRDPGALVDGAVGTSRSEGAQAKARIVGVDAARGVAVLIMFAVHVFGTFDSDGSPTVAWGAFAGRGVATFGLMAGISLALVTGGQRTVYGRARTAARAGLVVRALIIGIMGLLLVYVDDAADLGVDVILPYYAVVFLLAIPLLDLRPRVLAGMAGAIAVVSPVVIFLTVDHLPDPGLGDFATATLNYALHHPIGLAVNLLVVGEYPALTFLAYTCAGLALGRLDLSSTRLAAWLVAGGAALAAFAWWAATMLLYNLGGLRHLQDAAEPGLDPVTTKNTILWEPDSTSSWWSLAYRAPHSNAPFEILHNLGIALAVLGAVLLLTRIPVATRLLTPFAAAGSMILTIYVAHVLILATGVLSDYPYWQYLMLVVVSLVFAVVWRRTLGRGPLETLVSVPANRVRRAVAASAPETVRNAQEASRRERAAAIRREQQTRQPRRRTLVIAAGVVVAFLAAGGITAAVICHRTGRPSLAGVATYSEQQRTHVSGNVSYPQTPPAGGPHTATVLNCGIYDKPVPNESAVHDLEHGAVWITYRPGLPAGQVDKLRSLVRGQTYLTLSPYPGLPAPVVASAWGKQIRLTGVDDNRLDLFVTKYRQSPQAPEPGAPCTGGIGTPA